jgi:type VI secretion system secreted protein VgrG
MELLRVEEAGLATYRLAIVPRFWLLTQRKNYRIFQFLSDLAIVRQLLSEWGVEHEVRVDDAAHVARKFRVQYDESDYNFVCRLLEDAGVSWYFEASDGGTKLVLDDAPESRELEHPFVRFYDQPGVTDRSFVTKLAVRTRVRPGSMVIGDIDYRRTSEKQPRLGAKAGLPQEGLLEQFDHEPGAFLYVGGSGGSTPFADDRGTTRTNESIGDRKTKNRLAGKRNDAKVVTFQTDLVGLAPGAILSISDHPHRVVSQAAGLLVTHAVLAGEYAGEWRVETEAVPTSVPYRPAPITPKPVVRGLESATVVGPKGEEIHTDEFGRTRVHFHWDRESRRDETSSCWLPSAQPWAGNGFGAVNLPRIGQEVLVEFLGGDPDRPLVVGRVYTEMNPPPDPLPKYKHVTGLFSESTPRMVMGGSFETGGLEGGSKMSPADVVANSQTPGPKEIVSPTGTNHTWSGSGFKLDDWSGAENFYIQANKDMHWVIRNDWTTVVGAHRTAVIGTHDITGIKLDQKVYIGSDQDTFCLYQINKILKNRTDKVTETFTQEVQKGIKVQSKEGELYLKADDTITLDGDTAVEFRVGSSVMRVDPNKIGIGAQGNLVHINPK